MYFDFSNGDTASLIVKKGNCRRVYLLRSSRQMSPLPDRKHKNADIATDENPLSTMVLSGWMTALKVYFG